MTEKERKSEERRKEKEKEKEKEKRKRRQFSPWGCLNMPLRGDTGWERHFS